MSVVNIIDRVSAWADETICSKITLKAAPADGEAVDSGYAYRLVKPAVFPLFVPTTEKLPPNVLVNIPSICVRVLDGTDDMATKSGSVQIQLGFSTWNPGTHAKDLITCKVEDGGKVVFRPYHTAEGDQYFLQNGDGWRDAYNFLDIALREIESAESINGLQIDRSVPVTFGPFKEQDSIPDFYPLWFVWCSFAVRYPIMRNIPKFSELL